MDALLGTRLPIVQAPMAGVQDWRLAAAVSSAGGLGSVPAGMLTAEALAAELEQLHANCKTPWAVNFFCHATPAPDPEGEAHWASLLRPYYALFEIEPDHIPSGASRQPFDHDSATVVEQFRPPVVSFHYGLPEPSLLDRVKASGAKVFSTATTVDEALWLQQQGADAIIAQGLEAGGHRGHFLDNDLTLQQGTMTLVPQIRQAISLPVIAAGGIASPAAVSAALTLGADAVQVGTAYLLCPEATTKPVHREWLTSDKARHTALTTVFSGRPARGMVNRLMQELGHFPAQTPAFPLAGNAIGPLKAAAEASGSGEFSSLWAGQNASECRAAPAAEVTCWLAEGCSGSI